MKDRPPKTCGWCGAKVPPGPRGCPRGPQCAVDQRNHDELMDVIDRQDQERKR